MPKAPSLARPPCFADPWLRLAALVLLASVTVDFVISWRFDQVLEQFIAYEDPFVEAVDELMPWLLRLEHAELGVGLVASGALAFLLVRGPGRVARLRIVAWLAAVAVVLAQIPRLLRYAQVLSPPSEGPPPDLRTYLVVGTLTMAVASLALVALVWLRTRGRPSRWISVAAAGIGAAATLSLAWVSLSSSNADPDPWFRAQLGPLKLYAWLDLLRTLGAGAGLGLATMGTDQADPVFDEAAGRGLALARTAVWGRVILAVLALLLMLWANAAMRSATGRTFASDPISLPTATTIAPWVGYVEVILGGVMVVALAAGTLQRRSRAGALLVGLGLPLLLATTAASFALTAELHSIFSRAGGMVGYGFGGDIRSYAELEQELSPLLRGLGLLGTASIVVGLMLTRRASGTPSLRRPIRFLVIVGVMTLGWLYGQEALLGLGSSALLLVPVVLGAVIWALLDLTTFLAETADDLRRPLDEPDSGRRAEPGARPLSPE